MQLLNGKRQKAAQNRQTYIYDLMSKRNSARTKKENNPKYETQKTVIGTSNEISCILLYSSITNGFSVTN